MAADAAREGRHYRAFITYSHQDRRWAAWLHRRLEFYRVPGRLVGRRTAAGPVPRRLTPIFRDREELASADDLGERIAGALARSDALLVVCSPAAATSRWVNEEILRFRQSGRANRILCLITAGEPFASDTAGREADECFPPALRCRLDAGGGLTGARAEPLAADVRAGADGRSLALLKLVAGLLDLDLDELRRREQQRRNRRVTAFAATALAVAGALVVLTVAALISRHDAIVSREQAVAARKLAQQRRAQAERLVAFMLGNFTEKLRKLGRLDILESLDEQAMQYFESLPPGDVDEGTLIQRAKALDEIATTRWEQGDYDRALEAIRAELAITSELANRHPQDARRQNALGLNLQFFADVYWYQNKLAAAEEAMNPAIASLRRAAELAPADTEIQYNLSGAYSDLGHFAEARGERKKAKADYYRTLQISLDLLSKDTNNATWQDNLGNAYDNLGQLAVVSGDFVEAVRNYQEEQLLIAILARKDPSNQTVRRHLARIDGILGRTLFLCGQWKAGVRYLRDAVALTNQLVAYDPTQAGWRSDRAHYGNILARTLLEMGDAAGASALAHTSLADLETLVAKDPTRADWRGSLAASRVTAALIAHVRHEDDQAYEFARAAASSLETSPKTGPDTPDDPRAADTATALLLLAALADVDGDRHAAAAFRDRALAVIVPATRPSGIPRDFAALVAARLAAGDVAGARPAIGRLQRMGFRTPAFVALLGAHGIDYPPNVAVSSKIAQLIKTDAAAGGSAGRASGTGSPSSSIP